jgi:hypothetical protein
MGIERGTLNNVMAAGPIRPNASFVLLRACHCTTTSLNAMTSTGFAHQHYLHVCSNKTLCNRSPDGQPCDLLNPALGLDSAMVRIHDEGAFTVYLYSPPREHQPPHVHVECSRGGEVLIKLGDEDSGPALWQNHHMNLADARGASDR